MTAGFEATQAAPAAPAAPAAQGAKGNDKARGARPSAADVAAVLPPKAGGLPLLDLG
jgi:hypothetical protein